MNKEFKSFIRLVAFCIPATLISIVGFVVWYATLGHEKHLFKVLLKMMPEERETQDTPKVISGTRKVGLIAEEFKQVHLFIWGLIIVGILGVTAIICFIPSLGYSWKMIDYGNGYLDKLMRQQGLS